MPGVDAGRAPQARPRIVGFLCDFAVDVSAFATPDGTLRDLPNVKLIKVPCSGFIRPSWLEFALRNGAEGTFVCGCPLGDCFNRLGNNLIGDRVVQLRRRFERQRINPERIAAIYFGLHDHESFLAAVRAFSDRVGALPGPVVPAPRATPARPASPPAAGGAARPAAQAARPAEGPPAEARRQGSAPSAPAAPPGSAPEQPRGGGTAAATDGTAPQEEL